jgi:1-acyl-sn-glycerol-3-phosphate acyltransferase
MHQFKRGVALLVKRANCPVVPVAVEGVYEAWPIHRKVPRFLGQRMAIMYGEPIDSTELMKDGPDAALRRLEAEIGAMRQQLRTYLRESDLAWPLRA